MFKVRSWCKRGWYENFNKILLCSILLGFLESYYLYLLWIYSQILQMNFRAIYTYIYIYIDKSFGAMYAHKSMITWLYWLSLFPPSSVFHSMLCMNLRIIICLLRDWLWFKGMLFSHFLGNGWRILCHFGAAAN